MQKILRCVADLFQHTDSRYGIRYNRKSASPEFLEGPIAQLVRAADSCDVLERHRPVLLAMPEEIDQWIQCQQLTGGRLESADRMTLLLTLNELRSENRELRRQLEVERAKRLGYPDGQ
jgi:hypothetical protein